jgi:hypothetical protein
MISMSWMYGIAFLALEKTFHIVLKALIMLLFDGLKGFCSRWTVVRALKVPDEHGT